MFTNLQDFCMRIKEWDHDKIEKETMKKIQEKCTNLRFIGVLIFIKRYQFGRKGKFILF